VDFILFDNFDIYCSSFGQSDEVFGNLTARIEANFINATSPQFSGHSSNTNFFQTLSLAFFDS
jgi:hypothetical protein